MRKETEKYIRIKKLQTPEIISPSCLLLIWVLPFSSCCSSSPSSFPLLPWIKVPKKYIINTLIDFMRNHLVAKYPWPNFSFPSFASAFSCISMMPVPREMRLLNLRIASAAAEDIEDPRSGPPSSKPPGPKFIWKRFGGLVILLLLPILLFCY